MARTGDENDDDDDDGDDADGDGDGQDGDDDDDDDDDGDDDDDDDDDDFFGCAGEPRSNARRVPPRQGQRPVSQLPYRLGDAALHLASTWPVQAPSFGELVGERLHLRCLQLQLHAPSRQCQSQKKLQVVCSRKTAFVQAVDRVPHAGGSAEQGPQAHASGSVLFPNGRVRPQRLRHQRHRIGPTLKSPCPRGRDALLSLILRRAAQRHLITKRQLIHDGLQDAGVVAPRRKHPGPRNERVRRAGPQE